MNLNKLKEVGRSWTLRRNYSYKLNEARVADFPNVRETKGVEEYWNKVWNENDYFKPKNGSASFRMILPPPNVTGVLHLGHALTVTIQDVLARWHRMKGDSVLWVPGLDHAGIATQAAVEKYIFATRGLKRQDMGKEEFLLAVEEWKRTKGETIINQLKSLGASLDWSREYFTMSEEHRQAVIEAFVTLYNKNLLYRKKDLVNWSPALQSTISDIEVESLEIPGKTQLSIPGYDKKVLFGIMSEIAFKVKDSPDELIVATTRVESMWGDTALAVHPEDSRYSSFIGKTVYHPLREVFIPVIADASVQPDFGTGVLKITPAHDRTDLDIARRHNLELIEIMNEDGTLNENGKSFKNTPRFIAREKMLNLLADKGILRGMKEQPMVIPICSRSGDVIEYLAKEQWFIRMQEMSKNVLDQTNNNKLEIQPPKYMDIWTDRLENMKDWCVSRQLWWGHKIPAFACRNNFDETHWIVAKSLEEAKKVSELKFGSELQVEQDHDVLDTWFSAALLPLSAMGWPAKNINQLYPLNLMETGHDIINFWVARMAMLCTELTNKLPFEEVLLHGVLCDAQGKKMSKSLGNVINPEYVINGITLADLNQKAEESFSAGIVNKEELKRTLAVNSKIFPDGIPECGVDALRFTLCSHNIKNDKISFNVIESRTNKHFSNKIWQACRFILLVTDNEDYKRPSSLPTINRWILSRLAFMVNNVDKHFKERNFYKATRDIREFFHYEFCDFYLEAAKFGLKNTDQNVVMSHKYTLVKCLEVFLRVLAPVMPYFSEDLYSRLSRKFPGFSKVESLMEATYPNGENIEERRDDLLEERFQTLLEVVSSVRNVSNHVNRKDIAEIDIVPEGNDIYQLFADNVDFIQGATKILNVKIHHKQDYVANYDAICNEEAHCKIHYLLTNQQVAYQLKDNIQRKRQQIKKKLEQLLETVSTPQYSKRTIDADKARNEEKIKDLQEKLRKYPGFV